VIASAGYPEAPLTGRSIEGAEPSSLDEDGDVLVFHAGTRRAADGSYETTGGRVVTVVGRGDGLAAARGNAYRGVAEVRLDGGMYRTDIAAREVAPLPLTAPDRYP
jgi:phosphoribosylamine--glycine ligase